MTDFKLAIKEALQSVLKDNITEILVTECKNFKFGHFTTNIALSIKQTKDNQITPQQQANQIIEHSSIKQLDFIEKCEVAGPGYINFFIKDKFLIKIIEPILQDKIKKNDTYVGKTVIVEYTDPNAFKEFHIGHLMPNVVGECIARLYECNGAVVKRVNYQGDVGLHVAKSLWGLKNKLKSEGITIDALASKDIDMKVKYLGESYVLGNNLYESSEAIKSEIDEINKQVYNDIENKNDSELLTIYNIGRNWSLEYFETIYKILGTKFDHYFFESDEGLKGKKLVLKHLEDGIFEKSEGAIVFKGEKFDKKLHTRVFINKLGLPTYEAKEVSLAFSKSELFKFDISVVVTGNEINEYFKVLLRAISEIDESIANKIKHLGHGMLRLTSGKMSSRLGNVIIAMELIEDVSIAVKELISSATDAKVESTNKTLIEEISIAAIKYSILKIGLGNDITFNPSQAIALTGDTGPYLQYTNARALSVFSKSKKTTEKVDENLSLTVQEQELILKLYNFEEIIKEAALNYAPNKLCTYLFELAQIYNSFYNAEKIIGSEKEAVRVSISMSVSKVLTKGLWVLGIKAPKKM